MSSSLKEEDTMDVLVRVEYGHDLVEEVEVEELCIFCMKQLGLSDNTEVSISFVSNDEIARLNEEYRGKVGPTDVLSFECDNVDDVLSAVRQSDEVYELGEIIIAPDVAAANSDDRGGLIHLCGYEHIEDDEAEVMEAREQELLDAWRAQ